MDLLDLVLVPLPGHLHLHPPLSQSALHFHLYLGQLQLLGFAAGQFFSGVVTSGSKLSEQNTGTYVCRWQSWIPTLVTSGQKRVSCKLQQHNFEMMLQVLKQAKECYQTWWIQFTLVWWKWAAMQGCPNCLLSRGDTCTLRREATSQPRGQWDNRNSFKLTKPESPK